MAGLSGSRANKAAFTARTGPKAHRGDLLTKKDQTNAFVEASRVERPLPSLKQPYCGPKDIALAHDSKHWAAPAQVGRRSNKRRVGFK